VDFLHGVSSREEAALESAADAAQDAP